MSSDRIARARQTIWGPAATRLRKTGLRSTAINSYRAGARLVLVGPPPRVFANSIPKSGTHLMTQVLTAMPRLWFSAVHVTDADFTPPRAPVGTPVATAPFRARIGKVRNGQYLTAHMGASPNSIGTLDELGFVRTLMVRDPRDIAVSLAEYYGSNARLKWYPVFSAMPSEAARLDAVITGLPATDALPALPPLAATVRKYLPWRDDPQTLVVAFEDLVGAAGGGSDSVQRERVEGLLELCRRPTDQATVESLLRTGFARGGATFRRGAVGTWEGHFSPEQRRLFEQDAQDSLAVWGR